MVLQPNEILPLFWARHMMSYSGHAQWTRISEQKIACKASSHLKFQRDMEGIAPEKMAEIRASFDQVTPAASK